MYYHSRKTRTPFHPLDHSQNSAEQKPKCSTWKACYIVFNARNIFTKDYMKAVDPIDVELCKSGCIFREGPTFDSNLFELLIKFM